jgi:trehalose-phosphatase
MVTASGEGSLDRLIARATALLARRPLLVASDFDGTLSYPQADPWAARIHRPSQRALRRLSVMPGVHVVLYSGRTVADLASRTRIGGVVYLGDHGVERAEVPRGFRVASMRIDVASASADERLVADRLADLVPRDIPEPWLVVERKSAGVTFHFRAAPDVEDAGHRLRASIERYDPSHLLERHIGRRAIELRPPTASTKAIAMTSLVDEVQPRSMLILGDGLDDAAAFRALRAVTVARDLALLRLAVAGHPEVTAEVAPHADGLLASPRDVGRLLRSLADPS